MNTPLSSRQFSFSHNDVLKNEHGTTTSSHIFEAYPKIIENSAFMRLLPADIVSVDKLHHVIIVIPPNDPKIET